MSKKRVMSENMPSPQLKDIQFSTLANNENIQEPNEKTTPKHHSINSSQGSQGLRRSVGLLNLSIETSPNPEASSSPKFLLRKKKLDTSDLDNSDYINDVENWSPFKEPATPTSKSKNQLKRPASNSGSLSPFINDNQKPLLFTSDKENLRSQQNRTNIQVKFNKLRKMVSLEKMNYDVESPFDNALHPLPNPSIHYQQAKLHSPTNSPSRPAKQRPKVEKSLQNKNLTNLKGDVSMDGDFITPNSYKFVKPLQTAFMSSGLLSKKNRKLSQPIHPPETPCKKPVQPALATSQKNSLPSSNLANVITASSPIVKNNSTPRVTDDDYDFPNDPNYSQQTPSANNTTTTIPRSARALNTNELRDCILKFTTDFDESADSIFDDDIHTTNELDDHFSGPATPTRLKFARGLSLAKSMKLKTQLPIPVGSDFVPKTPVDVSIDTSGDLSNVSSLGHGASPYVSTAGTAVTSTAGSSSVDDHLTSQFQNVQLVGKGEFSNVFEITFQSVKYAVKRIKTPFMGSKRRKRIFEEVELLKILQENQPHDDEGKEYVINFINDWEHNDHLYIMTEFCENGSLDKFLLENGNLSKLDEWRIWKILVEIGMGLKYIHSCEILHLDLKPANIFITFEGSLKIGDFGLASKYPVQQGFEREGDREYIAPEIISRQIYDKPADVFSFGLIMVEIAANIILPDNGVPWQKLRSGDLTDAGRLSSTELNINLYNDSVTSKNSIFSSMLNNTVITGSSSSSVSDSSSKRLPPWTPKFLIDGKGALDTLVQWMISPVPEDRPTAADILNTLEAQFVEVRRKAGAVIFEGEYGPAPDNDEESLMHSEIKKLNFGSTATLTIPSDIMDEDEW